MDGILSFIVITIFFIFLITLFSWLFKSRKVIVPLLFSLLGIGLIIMSFFIGNWKGMGMGFISLSLLIASVLTLVGIVIIESLRNKT